MSVVKSPIRIFFQVTTLRPACGVTLTRLDLNIRFVTKLLDSRHVLLNMMTVSKITDNAFISNVFFFRKNNCVTRLFLQAQDVPYRV